MLERACPPACLAFGHMAAAARCCGRLTPQALVSQLQSWNSLRRLGASGAIKNCAMAAEVGRAAWRAGWGACRLCPSACCGRCCLTGGAQGREASGVAWGVHPPSSCMPRLATTWVGVGSNGVLAVNAPWAVFRRSSTGETAGASRGHSLPLRGPPPPLLACLQEDGTLGDMLQDTVALGHLLRPINGQPPLEPEATVRECVAEAVLALARTDKGRDALWEAGAPEALRKGWVGAGGVALGSPRWSGPTTGGWPLVGASGLRLSGKGEGGDGAWQSCSWQTCVVLPTHIGRHRGSSLDVDVGVDGLSPQWDSLLNAASQPITCTRLCDTPALPARVPALRTPPAM